MAPLFVTEARTMQKRRVRVCGSLPAGAGRNGCSVWFAAAAVVRACGARCYGHARARAQRSPGDVRRSVKLLLYRLVGGRCIRRALSSGSSRLNRRRDSVFETLRMKEAKMLRAGWYCVFLEIAVSQLATRGEAYLNLYLNETETRRLLGKGYNL